MAIHSRIKDRAKWLRELWNNILEDVKDKDVALIIYKRLVFEER